ncbi:MAG TPA: DUF3179 domain-containing (seleno)protein [Pirellulales bacterium]|jgi:hypothetical protein|nr:DUF3179 domain-containing (seleno)protein [Pirellulales bacterium]
MRSTSLLFACVLWLAPLSALAQGPKAGAEGGKQLFRPELFETLVNPNCSHCVDEAKRRSAELRDDDRVLSWTRGKYEGGAIPWRFFLVPYRVISDTYGVFVYDAEAGFVRGYEPSLDFRFHGWRNGVMVIRHKDGTLFSALSGRAFDGPRKGEQLKPIATIETDWGFWTKAYPGSVAYHMFEKYQPRGLPAGDNADSLGTRLQSDPRGVDGRTRVIGLSLGNRAKAWPLAALEAAGGIVEDELAGEKLLVLWYPATQTAAIYSPTIEDTAEATPQTVRLVADGADERAPFRDRETGSHWGIEGRAVDGPLKGKTLRWLPAVQCRWFAWAAEYPETALHAGPRDVAPAKRAEDKSAQDAAQGAPAAAGPLSAVIVQPETITTAQTQAWRRDGYGAVAVVLDERHEAVAYRLAAQLLAEAGLDLYYWIEVARQPGLSKAHPEWMASLGLHGDWHERFPQVPLPKSGEVAKTYPWVPIGYRPAYDAHQARIAELLTRASGDYRGLLLNDLQGGPASCGCGNLQCRWAIDYGVASTADKLAGDDVAARFVADVRKLTPDKKVIPVWLTECEDRDLPAERRPNAKSTGYCGGVGCSQATCPVAFTKQWNALLDDHDGPIGLLALHKELGREGVEYGGPAAWVKDAVGYLDEAPPRHGGKTLARERLWLVVQGYDLPAESVAAARKAAVDTGAGAVFVAQTRIDQSYEPRITAVEGVRAVPAN